MKVLLTGSEGFIGGYVRSALHRHEVETFDLKNGQDVREPIETDADVIVHLAGLIDIKESFEKPYDYYMTNAVSTGLLPRDQSVILESSASVYGNFSPYKMSKVLAEKLLPENSVALRIFNPFGAGENHNPETHLIPILMEEDNAIIYNNGEQIRNFIHVVDVAVAIRMAVESDKTGVYDVCADEPLSVKEVIDLMGVEVQYEDKPRDSGDSLLLNGDNSALKRDFGWTQEIDVKKSLRYWRGW